MFVLLGGRKSLLACRGWVLVGVLVGFLVVVPSVWAVAPSLGGLTPLGCFENTGGGVCGVGNQTAGLLGAFSVAVSPDGASVYAASPTSNAVVRFNRGADGALTPAGCIENTGGSVCGAGNQTAGLLGAFSVAVSPDGASVYVASIGSSAVVRFNRGADGALTPAGCIENTGGSVCGAGNQTAGLGSSVSVAVSPDGASVYAASISSSAVVRFNRGAGGALTPAGCFENTGGSVCGAGNQTAGLLGPQSVAVSPDGASVYVAGHSSNAVVRFARELAPSCVAVARNVAAATPTTIPIRCSDLNLDPLTLAIIGTPPAHGTLGPIDQAAGTVLYTPVAGYAGPDSFSYKANDGALDSNTATVSLSVVGAPPPVRPVVTGLRQSATKWRERNKLAQISKKKKPPLGTTFAFSLNEPAAVRLAFTRPAAGRKVSKKCVPVSKKNRKKPKCTRTAILGTLAFNAHAGANRVRFAGRLSATKKLKPGRYTLTITATSAGLRSTPRSLSFTIVK